MLGDQNRKRIAPCKSSWLRLLETTTGSRVIREVLGDDSAHKGYQVESRSGDLGFWRIAGYERYAIFQRECEVLRVLATTDIPLPQRPELFMASPIVCCQTDWIDGANSLSVLRACHAVDRYVFGTRFGLLLRQLHHLDPGLMPARLRSRASLSDRLLDAAAVCAKHAERGARLKQFLSDYRQQVKDGTSAITHGACAPEHLIVRSDGAMILLHYEQCDLRDPLEDVAISLLRFGSLFPEFVTGMLDSYFVLRPSLSEFKRIAFYTALRICEWRSGSRDESAKALSDHEQSWVWRMFSGYNSIVPEWYRPLPGVSERKA